MPLFLAAALAGLGPLDAWRRLVAWLQGLGVAHVCDIATARDLALLETAAEFVQRCAATTPAQSSTVLVRVR